MMTVNELSKEIKSSVEWLKEQDSGCCTIKLDDRLAVCVGWSDGYDKNDDTVIHSKEDPSFAINVGIKVWTSDDLRTDFDWINSPYYDNCEVFDTDCSISSDENYDFIAQYLLKEYGTLSRFDIDEKGKIKEV